MNALMSQKPAESNCLTDIHQEVMDAELRTYLLSLTKENPATIHFSTSAGHINDDLRLHVPAPDGADNFRNVFCGWLTQNIYPLVAHLHAQAVEIGFAFAPPAQLPPSMLEPESVCLYITLDIGRSLISVSHLVAGQTTPPELDIPVENGVTILAQPRHYQYSVTTMDRGLDVGGGATDLAVLHWANRNRDLSRMPKEEYVPIAPRFRSEQHASDIHSHKTPAETLLGSGHGTELPRGTTEGPSPRFSIPAARLAEMARAPEVRLPEVKPVSAPNAPAQSLARPTATPELKPPSNVPVDSNGTPLSPQALEALEQKQRTWNPQTMERWQEFEREMGWWPNIRERRIEEGWESEWQEQEAEQGRIPEWRTDKIAQERIVEEQQQQLEESRRPDLRARREVIEGRAEGSAPTNAEARIAGQEIAQPAGRTVERMAEGAITSELRREIGSEIRPLAERAPGLELRPSAERVEQALKPEIRAERVERGLEPLTRAEQVEGGRIPETRAERVERGLAPETRTERVERGLAPETRTERFERGVEPQARERAVENTVRLREEDRGTLYTARETEGSAPSPGERREEVREAGAREPGRAAPRFEQAAEATVAGGEVARRETSREATPERPGTESRQAESVEGSRAEARVENPAAEARGTPSDEAREQRSEPESRQEIREETRTERVEENVQPERAGEGGPEGSRTEQREEVLAAEEGLNPEAQPAETQEQREAEAEQQQREERQEAVQRGFEGRQQERERGERLQREGEEHSHQKEAWQQQDQARAWAAVGREQETQHKLEEIRHGSERQIREAEQLAVLAHKRDEEQLKRQEDQRKETEHQQKEFAQQRERMEHGAEEARHERGEREERDDKYFPSAEVLRASSYDKTAPARGAAASLMAAAIAQSPFRKMVGRRNTRSNEEKLLQSPPQHGVYTALDALANRLGWASKLTPPSQQLNASLPPDQPGVVPDPLAPQTPAQAAQPRTQQQITKLQENPQAEAKKVRTRSLLSKLFPGPHGPGEDDEG